MNSEDSIDLRTVSLWIHELEEGTIAESDRVELMQLMRERQDIVDLYLENTRMSALIRQAAESRVELGTMPVSVETLRREKRRSALISLSYAAAAVVLLAAGLLFFRGDLLVGGFQVAIRLESSEDAAFAIVQGDDSKRQEGRLQPGDQVTVERGLVRFAFPSGVEGIVERPSQVELISANTLRMDEGMGWFRVPAKARGFTVRTNRGQVIDLGTEFGIRFDRKGDLEVHVADGRVQVIPSAPNTGFRDLREGEAVAISASGEYRAIELEQELFRCEFTRQTPRLHWSFDEGVEATFLPSGHQSRSSELAIEVKHLHGEEIGSCVTAGVHGDALSLDGMGMFAEGNFAGFEGSSPRTVAAWVRYRGAQPKRTNGYAGDPRIGIGLEFASGKQAYLLNYTNALLKTKPQATGVTLKSGVTHTLRFRVASLALDPSAEFHAEILAHGASGPVVVASESGVVDSHDFSREVSLSFTPDITDPNLGKPLGIRLVKKSGRVLYDDLRLFVSSPGESQRLVFAEDFEEPVVAGYSEGVYPNKSWENPMKLHAEDRRYGSQRHGIISEQSTLSLPILAWAGSNRAKPWVLHVYPNGANRLSLFEGDSFHDGQEKSPLAVDRWVHVAIVQTGRTTASGDRETLMYLDGKELSSQVSKSAFPISGFDGSAKMLIGAIPGSNPNTKTLDADIDELHVFRSVLSKEEISSLMSENYVVFRKKEYH